MNIFEYLFYLGIVNIVFGFIWKWVFTLPLSFLVVLIKFEKGIYLVKSFGAYILVSLTAILTLAAVQDKANILSIILFSLIGAFILFMGFASNAYETRKQAMMEYNYQMLEFLKYDGFIVIGSIILFILVLFVPVIATNSLTLLFFKIIDWAANLPIIGWLLSIGGIIFVLGTIWHGIMISGFLIGSLFGKKESENDVFPK